MLGEKVGTCLTGCHLLFVSNNIMLEIRMFGYNTAIFFT